MNNEQNFYRELADIPELPSDLFPAVDRTIRRRSSLRRAAWVIAASIPLVIGILTLSTKQPSRTSVVQPEVASELQTIQDYLNSSDLESDFELYAVVEGF
jgi:hypothetical protein